MAEKIRKVVEIEVDVNSSEVTQLNQEIKTTNSNLQQTNAANAGLSNQLNKTTGSAISGFKKFVKLIKAAAKDVWGVGKGLKETEKGTEGVGKGLKKVEESTEGVNKELKKVEKGTGGVNKELKKSAKGTSGLAGGFKKVGTAIKAAGIGLLISALGTLVQVFKNNQGAIDAFETGLTALKIAGNDLFKFLEANVGSVVDYFKSIFEDPKQALIDFAEAFKKNIQERFDSYLDTLGFLASAVKKVFSGDFAGAMDDVKAAGKESLDVLTGVNNSFDKATELVSEAVTAISDYTSETLKSAKATVELSKAAEIAAIQQQGLIEEFDRAAEIQRQIRDDETKSFEERIAANEKLGEILQDQIEAETALIDIQQRAIQDRLAKGLIPEFEAKKQLLELENERAAILAKVTGFESEQLINRNSLLREQRDLQDQITQQAIDRQKQLDDISLEIMQEGIDKELMMSAQKYDDLYAQAEGNAELQKQITEAQEAEQQAIRDKYDAERKAAEEKAAADQIALEREKQEQLEQLATDGLQALSGATDFFLEKSKVNAKRQFQITKGLQLALAIVDGIKAVTASLAYAPVAIGAAPNPAGIASLAFAVLSSAVAVAKIASAKYEPSGGGGGGGGGGASTSTPSIPTAGGGAPQFNTVGTSGFNQVAGSIAQQNQEPVKAYVVSTDVTSQQSLDRNSRDKSSF